MTAWSTSCLDWRDRLLSGTTLVPDLPLFVGEAERALRIFKRLRLPDVIGNPTMGEAFGDWVFDLVRAVFGAYDPATNRRMIQEFFLLVPKKNAKTTIAAAIMVVAIIVNRRPAAEFLLIAPTKEIADISFKQASGIIKLDLELTKLFHIQRHIRTITHRRTEAMIQIKAADTDVITGSKSTGILVDETHVFAKKSNAADVFVEIRGALAARPDGFMIQITTQSKEPPAGVFRQELTIARDVRDGRLALPLLPILYELPDDIAADNGWKRRQLWPLVNPNMGRSVDPAYLDGELVKAERNGQAALALLASQHFNVEIGIGLKTDRWVGADLWRMRADASIALDEILARSEVAVIGIDGGGADDLLAIAVLGRDEDTRRWMLWVHAWAHEAALERRKSEAPKLRDLEQAGDLTVVAEMGKDIEELADIVERVADAGLLPEKNAVGLDPMGVGMIVDALVARGITTGESAQIVAVTQGWKLNGAIKTTERKLADGTLVHGGQPIMDWAAGNAKPEPKGNAVTITKQAAGTAKIDPLMAAFDAVALMTLNPPSARSVFDALADDEEAQSGGAEDQSEAIDEAILADPSHPMWATMRERWERKFTGQERDEF